MPGRHPGRHGSARDLSDSRRRALARRNPQRSVWQRFSTIREMWGMLTHDNCPVLFPLVIRFWSAIGLGGADFGLRCLGFVIGLSVLAALWLNARVLRSLPPVCFPRVCSPPTSRWCGRAILCAAYGLGCVSSSSPWPWFGP